MIRINCLVDWGKSFVDTNGSFYCGTTDEQKGRAAQILNTNHDLTIFFSDVHSRGSWEFEQNGGPYPVHNITDKDALALSDIVKGKTASPQLTDNLLNIVAGKKSGLWVPRSVFFQDWPYNVKPVYSLKDVENTFGVRRLTQMDPQDWLADKMYLVNAKHLFNGAAVELTGPFSHYDGIPDNEDNLVSMLRRSCDHYDHPQGKGLQFDVTGVVMGICIYQTASGIFQLFPKSTVNVIADSCTQLIYEPLGFKDSESANAAVKSMCMQLSGVHYISTAEYLGSG